MLSIFDPSQAGRLLLSAAEGWGRNYYEQRQAELSGQAARLLDFRRADDAAPQVQTRVWLPWTALDALSALQVDVHGSASGVRLHLECLDADGWGLRFYLGEDQAEGWRSFKLDPGDISATWGPCSGKRQFSAPLQPVALLIEDHADTGSWSLGLGTITAQAQPAPAAGASGLASCQLDRSTLALDISRGGSRLMTGFGLRGVIPGSAPRSLRSLGLRSLGAAAHGHYRGELLAGDSSLPFEVQLKQLSSAVWLLRYELQVRPGLQLERLELRGSMSYRAVQGLSYGSDESWLGELDGQPVEDPLLAEPPIWQPLSIGSRSRGRLRIKADGPVLKTLQLLDLRNEEALPEYAVEIVIARDESFSTPGSLQFGVLLDASL